MAAPAKPSAVFVRNLAFDVTDKSLESHFESIGPVKEAWIVRDRKTKESRGFGFVGFVLSDDAELAVSKLNGSTFGSRRMTVDLAKKKGEPGPKGPATPGKAASSTPQADGHKRPSPSSSPADTPSGGASPGAATGAPPAKRPKSASPARQRHRVILRNLAFSCNADVLRTAVGAHAEVLDVHFPARPDGKPPGFAFVEVPTAEACAAVVLALNETKICGRLVAADVAMHKAGYDKATAAAPPKAAPVAAVPQVCLAYPRSGISRAVWWLPEWAHCKLFSYSRIPGTQPQEYESRIPRD